MSDGLTIESFASDLAAADKPEQPAQADSGADAQTDGEDLSLGDAQDATEAAPEDGAAPEQDAQAEQPPEDSAPAAEPVHKWTTANGESFEVAESELRAGYLRQQDYTQKSQQAAEQFRQSQAQIQQQATQQAQVLAQMQQGLMYLGGLDAQIQALQAQNLPTADIRIQRMQAEQQLNAHINQFATGSQRNAEQMTQQAVSAAEARLAQRFPGLTAQTVTEVFQHVHRAVKPTEAELNLIRTNPGLAELAIHAGKWLDLQAKKPEVQNKVRKLPSPSTKPRAAVPTSKTEAALKAINSARTFSTGQFAELLKATRQ